MSVEFITTTSTCYEFIQNRNKDVEATAPIQTVSQSFEQYETNVNIAHFSQSSWFLVQTNWVKMLLGIMDFLKLPNQLHERQCITDFSNIESLSPTHTDW